ncbi:spermine/spermidine synthase [Murinocardiopsis flavida]|uniref:Spermine/spermidine synthase n=1 Tax=Murinocardiopsis flavida TaxID=645275 RepID=A0A2P8DQF8_9ACTN|nr:spermidine synthase [Murinocardiopsis flavida]PSK99467.1 spermine/spermidine synthase [Murinocardiopsis flavida]
MTNTASIGGASPDGEPPEGDPVVLSRTIGATGGELVLRRVGAHFEIISNGVFLMDTRSGRSERAMVRASLDALTAADGVSVLIGGLGAGFSAREALDHPAVAEVCVVELEPLIVEWHSGPLGAAAGRVVGDPRCTVVRADLVRWIGATEHVFDAVCLDIDNGPEWTVVDGNGALYGPAGLARLDRRVRPGGVLAFWSAMPAPAFAGLLGERYGRVDTVEVPAERGGPDLVYLVRPPGTGRH